MSSLGVTAYYYSPNEVNIHYNVDNTVTTANAQSNNTDLLAYQTVQCPVIFDQSFQLYVALVGQGGGVVRTFELFTADYREKLATSTSTSYVFILMRILVHQQSTYLQTCKLNKLLEFLHFLQMVLN
jgi:hypothetical protein